MSQFFPLKVIDIERTTRDAVVLSLQPPKGRENEFAFRPGQYLTFKTNLDDTELRRSYSICSGLNDSCLRVGIKRVEGGGFSNWVHNDIRVGDTVEAMSPMGNFTTDIREDSQHQYVAFAAGSGITPVLSLITTILETEANSTVTLFYGNRNVASIMFREELEDLKNTYLQRFSIHHILSCGSDVEFLSGRIDKDKCSSIFEHLVDLPKVKKFFICGPEAMSQLLRDELEAHGVTKDRIKYELFGTSQIGRLALKRLDLDSSDSQQHCDLTIVQDGVSHKVDLVGSQKSVLHAALDANVDAPFACQAGVCASCRARVIEGEYEFVSNHALEDYEVERGFVLTCQTYPTGDKLVVEYEQ